jgi:hypothetical protein
MAGFFLFKKIGWTHLELPVDEAPIFRIFIYE